MSIHQVKLELLRGIRGRRSQAFVNKRLGFDYNQMYRWEAERVEISWVDFVKVCRACSRDVDTAVRKVFNYAGDPLDFAALTRFLTGTIAQKSFAKAVGVSTYRLRGWLTGKVSPNLVDCLRTFDVVKDQLTDFIAALGLADHVGSLSDDVRRKAKQLAIHRDMPFAGALLVALELPGYRAQRHAPGWLASRVGLSLAEEEATLARLAEEQLIERRDGHLTAPLLRLDLSADFSCYKSTRSYWLRRALAQVESVTESSQDNFFGYLAFSASDTAYRQVIEAYDHFYSQVRFIVENDKEPAAAVRLLGVQLFNPETRASPAQAPAAQ